MNGLINVNLNTDRGEHQTVVGLTLAVDNRLLEVTAELAESTLDFCHWLALTFWTLSIQTIQLGRVARRWVDSRLEAAEEVLDLVSLEADEEDTWLVQTPSKVDCFVEPGEPILVFIQDGNVHVYQVQDINVSVVDDAPDPLLHARTEGVCWEFHLSDATDPPVLTLFLKRYYGIVLNRSETD